MPQSHPIDMGKNPQNNMFSRLPGPKGQNQDRKSFCRICFAEGIIREFVSIAALNGQMAHKSSPKRRKKAEQIEKALDKIAGIFAGEPERKFIRHNGYEIM